MKLYLASNSLNGERYNSKNLFVENLKKDLPEFDLSCVFIVSNPDSFAKNDTYARLQREALENEGFKIKSFVCLDRRNYKDVKGLIKDADLIILAGGHVPTQNRFFQKLNLKKALMGYQGVILGVSAGAMNSAKIVYAKPEMKNDFLLSTEDRFIEGLGFTDLIIVPHYNQILDGLVDRVKRFEETVYPDNKGRKFYLLVDGSYIYISGQDEKIYGEAYLMQDGKINKINSEDDILTVSQDEV